MFGKSMTDMHDSFRCRSERLPIGQCDFACQRQVMDGFKRHEIIRIYAAQIVKFSFGYVSKKGIQELNELILGICNF
ncbi:hypothetical protein FQZ97_836470 [compost metagenome]